MTNWIIAPRFFFYGMRGRATLFALAGAGRGGGNRPRRGGALFKRNSGLETGVPRPLPVICWDWTKAIALTARANSPHEVLFAGSYMWSGARCPRPQSPHVGYYWNNHNS